MRISYLVDFHNFEFLCFRGAEGGFCAILKKMKKICAGGLPRK